MESKVVIPTQGQKITVDASRKGRPRGWRDKQGCCWSLSESGAGGAASDPEQAEGTHCDPVRDYGLTCVLAI